METSPLRDSSAFNPYGKLNFWMGMVFRLLSIFAAYVFLSFACYYHQYIASEGPFSGGAFISPVSTSEKTIFCDNPWDCFQISCRLSEFYATQIKIPLSSDCDFNYNPFTSFNYTVYAGVALVVLLIAEVICGCLITFVGPDKTPGTPLGKFYCLMAVGSRFMCLFPYPVFVALDFIKAPNEVTIVYTGMFVSGILCIVVDQVSTCMWIFSLMWRH